ncbi:MAG: DUF5752 family protein [Candidatus Margulisbacteria bacterium]|jgi:hypothetical protein|nr:DUF5752 family protein [Candidatus Margulisiibacteriota bacterium]
MRAAVPFIFYTSSQLVEITGRQATDLVELVAALKELDLSVVFYHVHHAFREHQFAPGVYTNDFAHWVGRELGEAVLAEKLANLNIKEYVELSALRDALVAIIESYLKLGGELRHAAAGRGFYFCKNIGVIQPTRYVAWDLDEFCSLLHLVGLRSLFFHFFEARLRLNRQSNDFSDWIKQQFGNERLARRIEALDPYIYTMDELRDQIVALICGGRTQPNWFDKVKIWLSLK